MVQEKVSWIPLRDKKKTAYLGVYLALALICSYVESLIPFYFGIPGVKLGLTNIVVVLMLYCVGHVWRSWMLWSGRSAHP